MSCAACPLFIDIVCIYNIFTQISIATLMQTVTPVIEKNNLHHVFAGSVTLVAPGAASIYELPIPFSTSHRYYIFQSGLI